MKFRMKDEDGNNFEIEEINEVDEPVENDDLDDPMTNDEDPVLEGETLSDDEIRALRDLIQILPQLQDLVSNNNVNDEDPEEDDNTDIDVDVDEDGDVDIDVDEDGDSDINVNQDEEDDSVVDTAKTRDSKSSFGSLQKKRPVEDSALVDDVADGWQERYNKIGGR